MVTGELEGVLSFLSKDVILLWVPLFSLMGFLYLLWLVPSVSISTTADCCFTGGGGGGGGGGVDSDRGKDSNRDGMII